MNVILTITNSTDSNVKLIKCQDEEEALCKMNNIFHNLCYGRGIDYDNTYFDKEMAYAQVVSAFEQIEMRIGYLFT